MAGSVLQASDEEIWPESCDVDIMLVAGKGSRLKKPGKLWEKGALLEVSVIGEGELASIEHVLSTHYLAYAMSYGRILWDPEGFLQRIHQKTKGEYEQRKWVKARCASIMARIEEGCGCYGVNEASSLARPVNGWAFSTGLTCFPILAAALRNCTVRKRYTAAREVLEEYGMSRLYPQLLRQLCPREVGRDALLKSLKALETTFDLACKSHGPSSGYAYRGDISPQGRPVAIGGSKELIDSHYPEEAVFWMAVTFARCHLILEMDSPEIQKQCLASFWEFLHLLEINEITDIYKRLRGLRAFLPKLEELAELVMKSREAGFDLKIK